MTFWEISFEISSKLNTNNINNVNLCDYSIIGSCYIEAIDIETAIKLVKSELSVFSNGTIFISGAKCI